MNRGREETAGQYVRRRGEWFLVRSRAALLPLLIAGSLLLGQAPRAQEDDESPAQDGATTAALQDNQGTIQAIRVEGNQRIETGTILYYMLVRPGDPFDPETRMGPLATARQRDRDDGRPERSRRDLAGHGRDRGGPGGAAACGQAGVRRAVRRILRAARPGQDRSSH